VAGLCSPLATTSASPLPCPQVPRSLALCAFVQGAARHQQIPPPLKPCVVAKPWRRTPRLPRYAVFPLTDTEEQIGTWAAFYLSQM
ncbi:mCG3276, partial [Mus musculus]